MDRNDIYGYIFNAMIMMPPIAMFAYAAPMEAAYWQWWAPAFFILPVVKYFSPSRARPYVYQIAIISVLTYMMIGQIRVMFGYTFFPFYLDNFTPYDFTLPFIFTLGTVIAFPVIFEGILSKKVQKTLAYMIWASASTIYFITAVAIAPFFSSSVSSTLTSAAPGFPLANASGILYAYEVTGDLIYINIYLLLTQGYEFITLILKPSPEIMEILTISFIVSTIGFISKLRISNSPEHRAPLEDMAYPLIVGGTGALAITMLVNQVSSTYYGFLIITVALLALTSYTKSLDRKKNYDVIIKDNDERANT